GRFPFLREPGSAGVSPAQPEGVGVSGVSPAQPGNAGVSPAYLYDDILQRLFHAPGGGGLHLCEIKGSRGEPGLNATNTGDYFGLIYIGDTSAFKKLVDDSGDITLESDAIAGSLFERINRPDSGLHVLIGARKFMEGWNSWRVASMGLLNIGRKEGSQIIQLFGRGVRLKGKAMSLKRSAALEGSHPRHLRLLETLNIFAVRANYMAQFRDYLEREGVEVEPPIELPLFVRVNEQFFEQGLVVPRPPQGRDFAAETALLLEPDSRIRVHVDMSVKVPALESTRLGLPTADVRAGQSQAIPAESLAWVDWQQAYLDLLAYKARKGWSNLVIHPETPRRIIDQVPCTIAADEAVLWPQSLADRALLQQAVTQVLCRYVDRFYQARREQWDEQTMVDQPLDQNDSNLGFRPSGIAEDKPGYVVKVPRSEQQLVEAVRKLLEEQKRLYQQENAGLPRIHFDRHIYQPLLVDMPEKALIAPPGLKDSEAYFVRDLREYWEAEKHKSLAGREVFLLRNLSRGYGIGFFEERGFYPDFILWLVDQATKAQRIVFIEPHGMLHAKAYIHDEKARLYERLPALAEEIGKRSSRTDITLDAFIVSVSSQYLEAEFRRRPRRRSG
ncbi:MAG: restriction endonuclease subunit R, partial [Halothiobacillaceae bacterium]